MKGMLMVIKQLEKLSIEYNTTIMNQQDYTDTLVSQVKKQEDRINFMWDRLAF